MAANPQAPEIIRIPVAEFDTSVLPAGAREPGTDAFETAVMLHFTSRYAARGWNATVATSGEVIRIVAWAEEGPRPKEYVASLLANGALEEALPLLEVLDDLVEDADIAYNHGLCLSELGRVEESVEPLERCLGIDADYGDARIALGVAQTRLGRDADACETLADAVAKEPHNLFAVRNLAGVLGRAGRYDEALPHFRALNDAQPEDPSLLFGLAQVLEELGGEHLDEAKQRYKQIITDFPGTQFAEAAVQQANRLASQYLHDATEGEARMDAVMYMQDAMDRFGKLSPQQIGQIVMEIAHIGQGGLAINDPGRRYRLDSLSGEFSGLQLLSLMHVGVKRFDANADPGTNLDREYRIAQSLRG